MGSTLVAITGIHPFNQVLVNPIQSKLQFKDFILLSSLSKISDRPVQFIDNVERVLFTLHCNSCNSVSV